METIARIKASIKLLVPHARSVYYSLKNEEEKITQKVDRIVDQLSEVDLGTTEVEDLQEILKTLVDIKSDARLLESGAEYAKKVLDGLERIEELTTLLDPPTEKL